MIRHPEPRAHSCDRPCLWVPRWLSLGRQSRPAGDPMRWLLDALKGFVLLIKDTAVVHPQAARGGFSIVMFLTIAVAGLMAINPAKFWWAPYVLIGTGVVILLLLVVGIIALGNEMAGGSGAMGGRTGVMLSELDAPPPEDPNKRRKQ